VIVPTAGLIDQVTLWLLLGALVTVAWNCWLCPGPGDTTAGLTERVTGATVIEKVVQMFPNVKQARPWTWVCAASEAGAVYKQLAVIVPGPKNNEHVDVCGTVQVLPPKVWHPRLGMNCCDCETSSVGLTGITAKVVVTGRTKTF